MLWLWLGVVNVQKIIGFIKLNLIQPWREVLVGFIILQNVWFYPITEITQSSPRRRDQVDWVSFDILMQFKFSVWSSNWADKLCISDRLIIWLAGLIRGRVAADYIQHNTVRTESREPSSGERDGTSVVIRHYVSNCFYIIAGIIVMTSDLSRSCISFCFIPPRKDRQQTRIAHGRIEHQKLPA